MNISISQLEHNYSQKTSLLRFESLMFNSNEATLITGKNGSGKTTLMRILAGLLKADILNGLRINNTLVTKTSQQKTLMQMATYMHQKPYMLNGSVMNSLRTLCNWRGKKADDDDRIFELLDICQLTNYHDRPAQQLSQGQQQRLALIRTVLSNAPFVLLDEPTANLDNSSIPIVVQLCQRLIKEQRIVAISSHDTQLFANITHRYIDCSE